MRLPPLLALCAGVVVLAMTAAGCSSSQTPPDWHAPGGSPTDTARTTPAEQAAALVTKLSDEDLVGQVLMPDMNLNDSPAEAAGLVSRYHLGSVILMGSADGADAAGTVRTFTSALRNASIKLPAPAPMLIGTDQEYGWVTRIKSGIVQLPSAMAFGAAGQPQLTENAWRGAGSELAALGVNLDFAPDADVIASSGNTIIGSRSFGGDPKDVSAQVRAAVQGLQSAGVAAVIKHFPGHGNTTVDSHKNLPVLRQSLASLQANDLPPFQSGIAAGAMFVMAGHLEVRALDPDLPASFSHKILTGLLRDKLGFGGVVVTDALNMEPAKRWPPAEAALRALLAGDDLLLMPPDLGAVYNGLLDALHNGRLPRVRLVAAATRVLTAKLTLKSGPVAQSAALDVPGHVAAARAAAAAAVTVLRGACTGPLVNGPVTVTTSGGRDSQKAELVQALRNAGVTVVDSGGSVVHLVGYGDTSADLTAGASVTVAMDTPYVLGRSHSPVLLATYSSTDVAMQALADVLAGKAAPTGRSPVPVSGLPRSSC